MKANELRIGNYLAASDGILCEVIAIELDGYKTKPVNPIQSIPVFQIGDIIKPRLPIPLTEEWLIKFGFESSCDDGYSCDWDYKKITICEQESFIEDTTGVEIKHVHQLQNLYFALTGEELEIQ